MIDIRVSVDPEECRKIWHKLWPQTCFFDLWKVRDIFADSFARTPFFVIAEERYKPVGVLALCFLEELGQYVFFPGETWQGKTWIEQNKIPVQYKVLRDDLLAAVPAETCLRYLTLESIPANSAFVAVDEENFRFHPRMHGYSFDRYMLEFSHKSRKNIARELGKLTALGVSFRYDHPGDVGQLLKLNLASYGDCSYFADQRFQRAFDRLCTWLAGQNMLRITTLMLGGRVAAVDAGAVWNNQYTVLAGGTDREFPGVAKIINFHHLEWACAERLDVVDFLCGDFSWKKRFHLQPCPLYKFHLHRNLPAGVSTMGNEHFVAC